MLAKINETALLVGYFSYPEFNVCRVLRPKVERMVTAFDSIEFLYIDIHRYPQISGQFIVFAVPTIIVLRNGKELRRISRPISVGELKSFLDRIVQLQGEEDENSR